MRIHNQTKQELLPLKSWTPGAFGGQCEPPALSSVTQFSQMVAGAGPPRTCPWFLLRLVPDVWTQALQRESSLSSVTT